MRNGSKEKGNRRGMGRERVAKKKRIKGRMTRVREAGINGRKGGRGEMAEKRTKGRLRKRGRIRRERKDKERN